VLVDAVGAEGAVARSMADAPEIDGVVHVAPHPSLKVGGFVEVLIDAADAYDLQGRVVAPDEAAAARPAATSRRRRGTGSV
jgi:ribosomal protein S12 methylthiotransferase